MLKMKSKSSRFLAGLLVTVQLLLLFSCNAQPQDVDEDPLCTLLSELSAALIMDNGQSFLTAVEGAVTPASDEEIAQQVPIAAVEGDVVDWEAEREMWRSHTLELENSMRTLDEREREAARKSLADTLSNLQKSAQNALKSVGAVVSWQLTSYCINRIMDEVLKGFGVDTRTTDEKILDKLAVLDDIYDSVRRIEDKIDELSKTVTLNELSERMADRDESLRLLTYATDGVYKDVITYLTDGYDSYLAKSQLLDKLIDTETYTDDMLDAEFASALAAMDLTEEDLYIKIFLNGDDTLSNYMMYRLMYHGEPVKEKILAWANHKISGNDITLEIMNLLGSYGGSTGKPSYPVVYDTYAELTFAWEHEGYEFRESLRQIDAAVIAECYTMTGFYLALVANTSGGISYEQTMLSNLLKDYNRVCEENPVVHHDDYYICQIPGCRYVFAKTPVYFDYYSEFKNTLAGCDFDQSDDGIVPASTVKKTEELFYNHAITYSYEKLDDALKNSYTFDHSAIGDADNPYAALDGEYIAAFADIEDGYMMYLPKDAYATLYAYYKQRNKNYSSVKEVLEKELGITFAAGTELVCDLVDANNHITSKIFSVTRQYHTGAFRITQKTTSKNKDYIDVRVCLNDTASSVKNIRFAENINLTNNECEIKSWGKAANRFGGLMVLGAAKSITD